MISRRRVFGAPACAIGFVSDVVIDAQDRGLHADEIVLRDQARRRRAAGSDGLCGGRVIRHATVSPFLDWTGIDVERFYDLDGGLLTLRAPPVVSRGVQDAAVFIW